MVSVIIPYYSAEAWIDKTIDSCLVQGEYLHEIIIVDDHSPDNGSEIIKSYVKKYPNTIKYYLNPKKGACAARNYGFSKATGQYIQWLDADDEILSGKFENQIKKLKLSGADICYSDWRFDYYEEGRFKYTKRMFYQEYNDFLEELLKDNWSAIHSYLMTYCAAKVGVEFNGWNETRRVGQDREFMTLLGIFGMSFVYQKGDFAVYNVWGNQSISSLDFKTRLALNQALERRFFDLLNKKIKNVSKRKNYLKIIYTHHLKALFYNTSLSMDYNFSLFQIKWEMVHWKMRFALPIIYIKKKYFE